MGVFASAFFIMIFSVLLLPLMATAQGTCTDVPASQPDLFYGTYGDSGRIYRVKPNGAVSALSNNGNPVNFANTFDVAFPPAGPAWPEGLYVSAIDQGNILRVTETDGNATSEVVATGLTGYIAGMSFGPAVAPWNGDLFVVDGYDGHIFRVKPNGDVSIFATGRAQAAQYLVFSPPVAPWYGDIFVSDVHQGIVQRVASDGTVSDFNTPGPAGMPEGLAFDANNNLLAGAVYGTYANYISLVRPDGSGVTPLPDQFAGVPIGLEYGPDGHLYVSVTVGGGFDSQILRLCVAPDGLSLNEVSVYATGIRQPRGMAFGSLGASTANVAPTITCPDSETLTCAPAGGFAVTVSANVTDPDSAQTLTVTLKEGTSLLDTQTGTTPAANALVTFSAVTLSPGAHTLTIEVSDGTASASCTTTVTVEEDTTKPTITCPANLSAGCSLDRLATVSYPAPTVSDNCDANPTVSCTPASGSANFPVGVTTVVCTARDAAGNTSTCSFTVTRAALGFTGFLPPIGGEVATGTGGSFGDPVRAFKLGSTIPVKFTPACGGSPIATGVHTLQATKYSNATDSDTAINATPTDAATTGNEFRLTDAATGEWHFNLNTKPLSVGTWKLTATLSDGSLHEVWVTIKK